MDSERSTSWANFHKDSSSKNDLVFDEMTETGAEDEDAGLSFLYQFQSINPVSIAPISPA